MIVPILIVHCWPFVMGIHRLAMRHIVLVGCCRQSHNQLSIPSPFVATKKQPEAAAAAAAHAGLSRRWESAEWIEQEDSPHWCHHNRFVPLTLLAFSGSSQGDIGRISTTSKQKEKSKMFVKERREIELVKSRTISITGCILQIVFDKDPRRVF